jgi:hypothetical protein
MNNWCICWVFTHIFTGILIFKGLTAQRLYKSFGVKGLMLALDPDWTVSVTLHLIDRRFRGCRCSMVRMVVGSDGWFGPCGLKVDISGTE